MSSDDRVADGRPSKQRRVEAGTDKAAPLLASTAQTEPTDPSWVPSLETSVSHPQAAPQNADGQATSEALKDREKVVSERSGDEGVRGVTGVTGVGDNASEMMSTSSAQAERNGAVGAEQVARGDDPSRATEVPGGSESKPEGVAERKGEGTELQAAALVTQGAYGARESFFQHQEDSGEISFVYVQNDGSQQNNIWLVGLKNIYSKQLPNMPKEYVTRLVLNRRHRSVGIVKPDDRDTVLGGITYRAFHTQGFGEIAFCAITAAEQVKGYGTRLMNFTKEYAKLKDHLTHFLTYADNNAVGYFSKQGFTKEITLPTDRWTGFIKDYDGGTLMECVLHPKLCYTNFPGMLNKQRSALESRIRKQSNSHIVHPGLKEILRDGVRRPIPVEAIPGVKDAGWDSSQDAGMKFMLVLDGTAVPPTIDNLRRFFHTTLAVMMSNEDAWPFLEPVDENDVPDYYDIIKDPVDMSLIKERLESHTYYLTLDIFTADFKRMFNNCRIYNAADTIYAKLATKLEAYFHHYLSKYVMLQT